MAEFEREWQRETQKGFDFDYVNVYACSQIKI